MSGLGRTTSSPLAQLGVLLAACRMLEGARAQLPSLHPFAGSSLKKQVQKGLVAQELKFFT